MLQTANALTFSCILCDVVTQYYPVLILQIFLSLHRSPALTCSGVTLLFPHALVFSVQCFNLRLFPLWLPVFQYRTHTRAHTRTHALTHTLSHTHTHTRTHAHTHTHTHAHTHTRTHAHTHTRTHAHTHTRTHAPTNTGTHAQTHTCTHAQTHTRTHAHTHTDQGERERRPFCRRRYRGSDFELLQLRGV